MDQKYIDLFDRYTHGQMKRRDFLERLAVLAGGSAAATALLPVLENNYARAEMVAENDTRILPETITYESTAGNVSGYLVKPKEFPKAGGVVVISENRGLNPHIKDVARRLATEGFLALAPDYLSIRGGTPEDADKARDMIGTLKPEETVAISRASLAALAARPDCTGKVAAVGFCWGGGKVNELAVAEPSLAAGVAYYGAQPKADQVAKIKAPLLLHYAGLDERINAGIPDFEKALKDNGKSYELFIYEGANHAFNNDTNEARYNKDAAELAWSRTVEFLKKNLAVA
ncbi:dienelactone hydrolase family protein [Nordella sp. HKS 07]|uniref:dienelactone hydrolase family protein n=1 Tax=Nordella sp. HKS 07 TaxID=2712222 RepID=UPI0013E166FB|nr:dienelactone hydrolase family protein [Nordella sp. HKS 07]QIG48886.1 dienelactone hydrolase family protein [Nordella sp. HKS 07]